MRDDRGEAAKALGRATADQDVIILVGGIGSGFAAAGKDDPFGAPLAGIGARPERAGKRIPHAERLKPREPAARKRDVTGKSVQVRLDQGGPRSIKNKYKK